MTNPLQKILPTPRKHADEDTPASSSGGEKQPLLGRLLPTTPKHKGATVTPSAETLLSPHDSVRVFDVKMPPITSDMVGGKLIPRVGHFLGPQLRQKRSRVSIEIHSDAPQKQEVNDAVTGVVEGLLRGDDAGTGVMEGLLRGQSVIHAKTEMLHDDEYFLMRIFRRASKKGGGLFGGHKEDDDKEDDEERSVSSISLSGVDQEFADGLWTEAYLYSLDDIEVVKRRRHTVELLLGRGNDTKLRDFNFANDQEATTFCSILESLGKLEAGRAQRRLEAFQDRKIRDLGSKIQLLVEIVSAVRLPVADLTSTDAYVTVHLGKDKLHQTDQIANTLNPVWTIDTGSLFLLDMTPEKFFSSGLGLSFAICDCDVFGQADKLGSVFVAQEELLEGNGKRVEYPIILDSKYRKARGCRLVLRFRQATNVDTEFMQTYAELRKKRSVGAFAEEAFLPLRSTQGGLLKREKRKAKTGMLEYRVKPVPDPERTEETTWMTEEQINAEALKPSKNWIEAGSHGMGKLYFEMIGCDGLPNKDFVPLKVATAGVLAGKTDSYACIIFEDSIVNTDVIYDSLCPRWMPWTQRAFAFHIIDPSSQLMLAILDYDAINPLDDDDPIGRVTIDTESMRPMTDYTMQFDLVTSSLVSSRKTNGTVTVRVRIEWESERRALIRAATRPPEIYVNVLRHRDYLAADYAIVGETDTKIFDMDTLTSFVEELQGYQNLLPVLKSAAFTVVLWRGHLPVTLYVPSIPPRPAETDPTQASESLLRRMFKPVTIRLPLHSVTAFVGAILLVEDYNLFPSFLMFGIAWMLLGTMGYQNSHPSPWRRRRTYWEHLQVLLFDRTFTDTIDPYEKKDEVEKLLADEAKRRKELEEEAAAEAAWLQKLAQEEGTDEAEVSIATEKKKWFGMSINLLEPILSPAQQHLRMVVRVVRIAKSFVTWEESRANFWIVNISIVAGLLFVGIPWGWLIRWILRIVIWIFLGPWMKLVDIFFIKGRTREEVRKKAKERLRLRYQQLVQARRSRQVKREDALKLKSMKRYMFGNYSVSVPIYHDSRYYDWALYPSHATPHVKTAPPKITASFHGQHLEGHMIPERAVKKHPDETSPSESGGGKNYGSTDYYGA